MSRWWVPLVGLAACTTSPKTSTGETRLVDCYQSSDGLVSTFDGERSGFTVSQSTPYEWWFDTTGVTGEGLVFQGAPHGFVEMADGTPHMTRESMHTWWDGERGLYRANGDVLERSDDDGETWTGLFPPIAASAPKHGLPNFAAYGDRVLIWTTGYASAVTHSIQVSEDRGDTWTTVSNWVEGSLGGFEIIQAAVGPTGQIAMVQKPSPHDNFQHLMVTSDDGGAWSELVAQNARHVAVADDGALWFSDGVELRESSDWSSSTGGQPVSDLHGTDANTEFVLGIDGRMFPQPGGRMGFRSVHGADGGESTEVLNRAFCVAGPDTTGQVVPVLDQAGGSGSGGVTPGKLDAYASFSSAGHAWALDADGGLISFEINTSYDSRDTTILRNSEPWFNTNDDRPAHAAPWLSPVALAVQPDTGHILVVTRPTDQSEGGHGTIWEIDTSGALTGTEWTLPPKDGVQQFATEVYPGPFGMMIVKTTGGVFDANASTYDTSLASGSPMAIDPVQGHIFYPDGEWLAKAETIDGLYAGRCDDVTVATQDCLDIGDQYLADIEVGRDGYLYALGVDNLVRRPIQFPEIGWESVASGFKGPWSLRLDTYEGATRVWLMDGVTVYAGVIGDTLPLERSP